MMQKTKEIPQSWHPVNQLVRGVLLNGHTSLRAYLAIAQVDLQCACVSAPVGGCEYTCYWPLSLLRVSENLL